MARGFRVTFDIGPFAEDLEQLGRAVPAILARSINRAGTAGKTAVVRAAAKDAGVRVKDVERQIKISRATRTDLTLVIDIVGRPIPVIAFGARGPEPSRGRGQGVSWIERGQRKRNPRAFIATMFNRRFTGPGSAHRGVFERVGRKRLPVREIFGPSIPEVIERHVPVFEKAATASWRKTLAHEISFTRSGGRPQGPEF